MKPFDVAIVGAGPAGSSAAISLSRWGYSVVLLDKEWFPREKLCGDFLNPINWPLLRELGAAERILSREHTKVTTFRLTGFLGEEAEARLAARDGEAVFGLGLRRSSLDHALLEKAASENVAIWQGAKPGALKRDAQGWLLRVKRNGIVEELHARMLIGADGRNSWVAHRLGMAGVTAPAGASIGFQLRLQSSEPPAGRVEIHLFPGGYAGIVGIGGNALSLCCAIAKDRLRHHDSLGSLLQMDLPQNPCLAHLLHRSQRMGEIRSTYPVYFPPRRAYADRVLLAGDAARVHEPVTGEGIYFALKSGMIAAESTDVAFRRGDCSAAQLSSYARARRNTFCGRLSVNSMLRFLMHHPALLAPIIRFSAKRRQLLKSTVQFVCAPDTGSR